MSAPTAGGASPADGFRSADARPTASPVRSCSASLELQAKICRLHASEHPASRALPQTRSAQGTGERGVSLRQEAARPGPETEGLVLGKLGPHQTPAAFLSLAVWCLRKRDVTLHPARMASHAAQRGERPSQRQSRL